MKMDILFHYNVDEKTGEITYIGKEEISVDTKSTKKNNSKVDNNTDPIVTLDSNKLILSQGAVDLLKAQDGCRIDIKYKKKENRVAPVIGTDSSFGTKSGNKLSKSNTISYRGSANEKLATYGTVFKMEPTEEDGIFYLVGNKEDDPIPDEIVDIEKELDGELDQLDNLSNFDFNLN